jgi:hypothetical protein
MSTSKDWLKHNHEALYNQGKQATTYLGVEENRVRMGITGANELWFTSTFTPKWLGFSSAFLAWENPSTRNGIFSAVLRDAEYGFVSVFRQLYSGLLRKNPSVTDNDLVAMGLPVRRGTSYVRVSVPQTYPDYTLGTSVIRRVSIHFRDHDSGSKARPHGVSGAVIRWGILDSAPLNGVEDLPNSALYTASPYTLTFSESQRRKMLYVCLAWQNPKGEMGPWGKVESAIVP